MCWLRMPSWRLYGEQIRVVMSKLYFARMLSFAIGDVLAVCYLGLRFFMLGIKNDNVKSTSLWTQYGRLVWWQHGIECYRVVTHKLNLARPITQASWYLVLCLFSFNKEINYLRDSIPLVWIFPSDNYMKVSYQKQTTYLDYHLAPFLAFQTLYLSLEIQTMWKLGSI